MELNNILIIGVIIVIGITLFYKTTETLCNCTKCKEKIEQLTNVTNVLGSENNKFDQSYSKYKDLIFGKDLVFKKIN